LAGHVYFQALRNIPVSLAPDGSGELSLHDNILSHDGRVRTLVEWRRQSG
jgi:hypothetical protein